MSNLSINSYNIFQAVSSGVNVYDTSGAYLGIVDLDSTSSVWADDTYMYVSTTNSGIYVALASGVLSNPLVHYKYDSDITDNSVGYIHGAGDFLCATTFSGVDHYNVVSGTRTHTLWPGASKCYQTTDGPLYYVVHTSSLDIIPDEYAGWLYYQVITFTSTNVNNAQVYVIFDSTFPFNHCRPDGEDLRFFSLSGQLLNHNVESWDHLSQAGRVAVKVPSVGTTSFYMIYGNPVAPAVSSPEDAYLLYDDFNGTSLDTDKWVTALAGSPQGHVTVANGYVSIGANDNLRNAMISKYKMPYGFTQASIRSEFYSTSDMDNVLGYVEGQSWNSAVRGSMYIGSYGEPPHTLQSPWGSSVVGAAHLSIEWSLWEFLFIEGEQSSHYGGEELNAAHTGIDNENYLLFSQACTGARPDLQIDWIKHVSWPMIETYTSTEILMTIPALHAVYDTSVNWSNPDYIYTNLIDDPHIFNDLHITEGTSIYNNHNVIFLATDFGAHVIEERRGNEGNSRTKRYYLKT